MRILNFGSCNIDHVYTVRSIVTPGETVAAEALNIFAGGKGLNQSLAIARSGAAVCHAGCIGNDGIFLKELLEASGVDTSYLSVTDSLTGHAIIQVDVNGENSILLHSGANRLVTKAQIDSVLADFASDDIVILQNEISNTAYIVKSASQKGIRVVLNPSPINDDLSKIDLSSVWLLILNQIEAHTITGEASVDDICEHFCKKYPTLNVVLTLGSKGSIFINGNERYACDAHRVEAVDTTGAGDTFLGYFVSSYAKDGNATRALRLASMAAALAVSVKGAAESIPHISAVTNALNEA